LLRDLEMLDLAPKAVMLENRQDALGNLLVRATKP
jgi:hypothetical protein